MAKTNVIPLEQSEERSSTLIAHEFKLRSLSGLLMHNPAGMRSEQKQKSIAVQVIPPADEEAAAAAYRAADGSLYLPLDHFRTSLLNGCLGRKIGRLSAGRVVAAAVMPIEGRLEVPLLDPDTGEPLTEYRIDIRRVVIKGQGVRRARPLIDRWAAIVPFEIDTEFVTVKMVNDLFGISGRVAGVGDYRPNRKGVFGRYKVVSG